jgi:error-prone DNA polymerase
MPFLPEYAELHCLSNFSFLRGASHPEELVARAAALGYRALALTDECSLAGVVRAHAAAKEHGLQLIIGSEIVIEKEKLVLLATDRRSYGAISSLITTGRRRGKKGSYSLFRSDVEAMARSEVLALWVPQEDWGFGDWVRKQFENSWIAVELHCGSGDRAKLERLRCLSAQYGLPLVAAGDAHMHLRSRR